MMKNLLAILLFASVVTFGFPAAGHARAAIEVVDNDFQNITINVSESVLHVTGANGQVVQIYNVAGVRIMSIKVDGADKRYELSLPKGCYIVKVGKTVRKISIK